MLKRMDKWWNTYNKLKTIVKTKIQANFIKETNNKVGHINNVCEIKNKMRKVVKKKEGHKEVLIEKN